MTLSNQSHSVSPFWLHVCGGEWFVGSHKIVNDANWVISAISTDHPKWVSFRCVINYCDVISIARSSIHVLRIFSIRKHAFVEHPLGLGEQKAVHFSYYVAPSYLTGIILVKVLYWTDKAWASLDPAEDILWLWKYMYTPYILRWSNWKRSEKNRRSYLVVRKIVQGLLVIISK